MSENAIEKHICEELFGDARKNALECVKHLRRHKMVFERLRIGYWKDKLYWIVKQKEECVCYILINNRDNNDFSWILWSDDSASKCYEDALLDEEMKKIAWKYIDFCEKCGSCAGGTCKTIFGKEFSNICRTTFRFNDPNLEALAFIKKMVEMRNNELKKKIVAIKHG